MTVSKSDFGVAGLGQIDGHADGVPGGHGAVHGDQDFLISVGVKGATGVVAVTCFLS